MSRDCITIAWQRIYEATGSVCSRPRDRLDGDASAHSALAGIYGRRGVVLFNPRLNLSVYPLRQSLTAKITTKKYLCDKHTIVSPPPPPEYIRTGDTIVNTINIWKGH